MRHLATLLLAIALAIPLAGVAFAADSARITVTGEGRVDASPDMATITLGVTSEGTTAAAAMAANSAALAQVLANLKAAGIADRDLQTTGLALNPNWQSDDNGSNPRIVGYVASNMLTVRVRALTGLGAALDAAVKDGANTVDGLSFGLADPEPVLDEARKRAVADATHRALLLTEAAGVSLGAVVAISESGGSFAPAPMFGKSADMTASAVPVASGEVSLWASVTMVWNIGQ